MPDIILSVHTEMDLSGIYFIQKKKKKTKNTKKLQTHIHYTVANKMLLATFKIKYKLNNKSNNFKEKRDCDKNYLIAQNYLCSLM